MTTVNNGKVSLPSGKDEDQEEKGFFNRSRLGGKSIWDWLDLSAKLAIPIMVVVATIWFGWLQGQLADLQHQRDQQSANLQHQRDQQSALDQQHATTLQMYIDNIQDLLLNHNLLGDSPPPKNDADKVAIKEVQELARARTLNALQGLDPHRKGVLLKFLFEAGLIGYFDSSTLKIRPPIIILTSADLTYTSLTGAYLTGAFLDSATLTHTDLASADLTTHTNLTSANLSYANLTGTLLNDANLTGANLTGANLNGTALDGANLQGTNVTQQQLNQVISCKRAILPAGLTCHHNQ